jgi:hypothetical protein
MDEAATWVWIHEGKNRAINLQHVTDIVFEQGEVPRAHLCLLAVEVGPAGVQPQRITVEGPEAEALRAYLMRYARHLEDLAAD